MTIFADALSHPEPATRDRPERTRKDMDRKWNKAWQTRANPKEDLTTADLGQNRQIIRQGRGGSSGQVKARTMI